MNSFTRTNLKIGPCDDDDVVCRFTTVEGNVEIITEQFADGGTTHLVMVNQDVVWSGWQDADDLEIDYYTGYDPLIPELDEIFQAHLVCVRESGEKHERAE